VEGIRPRAGLPEVAASRRLAARVLGTALGGGVRIGSREWRVVGVLDGGGTAFDSEIWTDRGILADEFKRYDYSAVVVRASDIARRDVLAARIAADPRLKLKAKPESLFYQEQSLGAEPIRWVGRFVSIVMGLGGAVCGMNIMFGFVLSRGREIGIVRALGFSRWSVVLSFMMESIMLGLGGGLVGCGLAAPLHGVHVGVMNYRTFSDVDFAFRVTWGLMGGGVLLGLGLSVAASVIPAVVAARAPIAESLRAA
jgi:putative ABC transport system permease protein